jgi:aspartyl-tRNA(Asn)/glutamyl-tRNA(Gln) amidotransferase subunit B
MEQETKIVYQPTIGLEVHIELKTKSKMFCACRNDPDEKHPNVNICPICLGHPGTLPVINEEAVKKTIKTGLALNCQILEYSKFDRKNYFYPDLPKGYQISQYDMPFCKEGYLEINGKRIRIRRLHLEEDTGRLLHERDYSLVDFNRAGIPLMELVTEPDINSAKEARKFAEELQLILRYLGVSDADMEKGQMRVEANVSLQAASNKQQEISNKGQEVIRLGTKVEIKNLNSFRSVEKAIDYEISRQIKLLGAGKKIIQETRGWHDQKQITFSQREKEEAHEYRYFPEPDLPSLHFTEEDIAKIRAQIPELPQQKRERFKKEYQLDEKSIEIFVVNKDIGEFYEKTMSELRNWIKEVEIKSDVGEGEFLNLTKLCANYMITDLQALLKKAFAEGEDFLITPENFAEFITLIYEGKISSKIAKMVLAEMFSKGTDPSHIIEESGLAQITDEVEIEKIVKEVILQNQKAVEDFKKGKENALQFLVGKVMAVSKGKANPQEVNRILNKTLQ